MSEPMQFDGSLSFNCQDLNGRMTLGDVIVGGMPSPNGTRWKISVANDGTPLHSRSRGNT